MISYKSVSSSLDVSISKKKSSDLPSYLHIHHNARIIVENVLVFVEPNSCVFPKEPACRVDAQIVNI